MKIWEKGRAYKVITLNISEQRDNIFIFFVGEKQGESKKENTFQRTKKKKKWIVSN